MIKTISLSFCLLPFPHRRCSDIKLLGTLKKELNFAFFVRLVRLDWIFNCPLAKVNKNLFAMRTNLHYIILALFKPFSPENCSKLGWLMTPITELHHGGFRPFNTNTLSQDTHGCKGFRKGIFWNYLRGNFGCPFPSAAPDTEPAFYSRKNYNEATNSSLEAKADFASTIP